MGFLKARDPLLNDKLVDELYSESHLLENLESLITQRIIPPYSICINGAWGSGKTTFLKLIEKNLRNQKYPIIWFNPWEYERTDGVVISFMQQLAIQFQKKFGLENIGIFSICLFTAGLDVASRFLSNGNLSYENIQKIVESVNKTFRDESYSYTDLIEKIKTDFARSTQKIWEKNGEKPLIIFFDDLDRCLPENTIGLLEALKNLFVVKNAKVIFISGIDSGIAKQFIIKRYEGISEDFALNYFKKIFNLTVDLPKPNSSQLDRFVTKYIEDLFGETRLVDCDTPKLSSELVKLCTDSGICSLRSINNIIDNFFVLHCTRNEYLGYKSTLSLLIIKENWNEFFTELTIELTKHNSKNAILGNVLAKEELKEIIDKQSKLESFIKKNIDSGIPIENILRSNFF